MTHKKRATPAVSLRSERKRRQILDAAADVVAQRGYANTMLAEIAARIEVQPGALYYHFESREHLFTEVLRQGMEDAHDHMQKVMQDLPDNATPIQRLEAGIHAHFATQFFGSSYSRASYRIIGEIPDEMRITVQAKQKSYRKFLVSLVRSAVDAGELESVDCETFVFLLLGAINYVPQWFNTHGRMGANEVYDLLVKMIVHGVVTSKGKENLGGSTRTPFVFPVVESV
ncbi:TetR/AcrR family transcriptional regulator [Pseudomonas putida]|uniref:TetR/AcrR family transcriptional regulator n=1 Tax=Pseudomonas putida TaxID=303 RepID=UPI0018ABBB82|nr:TetR/AcrR family transcriptional regulator [Pseudomonas putida]MBF8668357.1 TetR/AcrR family transcriptional regulator [Pseudomonas putida]MBF8710824.1 TetR/AcrR family transcriptional regulator [Pseudomonas putida]